MPSIFYMSMAPITSISGFNPYMLNFFLDFGIFFYKEGQLQIHILRKLEEIGEKANIMSRCKPFFHLLIT